MLGDQRYLTEQKLLVMCYNRLHRLSCSCLHHSFCQTCCSFSLVGIWPQDNGLCIPVSRNAHGQCLSCICRGAVECGYQNLWYMRQCVKCNATHGAIELTARVSAILQVRSPCMSMDNTSCAQKPCRSTCRVVRGVSLIGASQKWIVPS